MSAIQVTKTIHYDSSQNNEYFSRIKSPQVPPYFFKDNSDDFLSGIESNHSFGQRIYYQLIRKGYNLHIRSFHSFSEKQRDLRESFESHLKNKYGLNAFTYVMNRLNLTDNIISKRKITAGFKLAQQYTNNRILTEFSPAINNCKIMQEKIESISHISKQYNLNDILDMTIKINNIVAEKISNQDSSNILILIGYANMCYLKLLNQLSDRMASDINLDKHSDINLPNDLLVKLQNKITENFHKQEIMFNSDIFINKLQKLKTHLNENKVKKNLKEEVISELVLSIASEISKHVHNGNIDLHYHLDLFHSLLHIGLDSDQKPIIKPNPYALNKSIDNILNNVNNVILEGKLNQRLKKNILDNINKSQFFTLSNKSNSEIMLKEEYINKLKEEEKDNDVFKKETLAKLSELVFLSEFNTYTYNILTLLDELISNKISKIERNLDPLIKKSIIEQTKNIYSADDDAKKIILVTKLKEKIINSNDVIRTNQDIISFISRKIFKNQGRILTLEKTQLFLRTKQSESLLQRAHKNIEAK
ncbi:hypothetical protein GRH07_002747 [Salmonella bongori]|nr:hypothetical protein [Salmonella bongori]EDP8659015.1 hypothetical protein [Salmonella bongori]EIU0394389.1 hypothetical protein [Salmonella bongori]